MIPVTASSASRRPMVETSATARIATQPATAIASSHGRQQGPRVAGGRRRRDVVGHRPGGAAPRSARESQKTGHRLGGYADDGTRRSGYGRSLGDARMRGIHGAAAAAQPESRRDPVDPIPAAVGFKRGDAKPLGRPQGLRAVIDVEHPLGRRPEPRQLGERPRIGLDEPREARDQQRIEHVDQPRRVEDRQHPFGTLVGQDADGDRRRPAADHRDVVEGAQHRRGHLGLPTPGLDGHTGKRR